MEPIAVVGIGCRFPKANHPEAFWQLLYKGENAVDHVPKDRWNMDAFYDPDPSKPGKANTRWGAFLDQIDQFDANFFGLSTDEVVHLDPQQRLVLEVAWEALEHAGIVPADLAGTHTGVFMGLCTIDYHRLLYRDFSRIGPDSGTGTTPCITANRLSYLLDLRGPSMAIDSACSSSLVTVHLACQSLRSGEADLCLAGGVNLILSPDSMISSSQMRMLSSRGCCNVFDAAADGYVRGEGCGVVVLKRLSDAVRDGNPILALIKGSAVNQDGLSNSLTAPNGLAQQAVIRRALDNGQVQPQDISYVEAHAVGTPIGDAIEFKALKAVLMEGREPDRRCWIGSAKPNIGHLEAASGMAALIKVILSLQHEKIPAHLHLEALNPYISLDNTPLAIPTEVQPWPRGARKRLAGVSAFGFGGSNAHIVLEEAPLLISRSSEVERPSHVFTLSAKSESALKALAHRYTTWLTDHPEAPLADVCFSANAGRSHFEYRLAVVADSTEQLHQQLKAFTAGAAVAEVCVSRVISKRSPKIAFLFTGQGSQYVEMGRQLYETQPTFRGALDQCAEILQTHMGMSLLDILYLDRNCDRVDEVVQSMPPGQASKQASKIDQTAYAQPALFAVEYALARLWQSWGIQPTMVMGHSLGEYVAACIAGVFSLEDGLKLVAHRAKLMQALPEIGKMASVFADEATVRAAIAPYPAQVSIAAFNGPQNIVLSGETTAVNQVIDQLAGQGVKARRLQVSHAFHSPLMEPMLAEFGRVASEIVYRAPSIEIISNLTGQGATADIATPQYWVDHVRQPVQFTSSIEFLSQKKCQIFLEIGAKPTLSKLGQTVGGHAKSALWLSCLRPGREDWPQLLESLRALYARGVAVDWAGFDRDYPRRRMTLPTYPFQRQRYWFESTESEFEELIPVFSESHNEGDSFVRLEEVQTVLQFLRSQKRLSKQEPSTGFSSIPGQDG